MGCASSKQFKRPPGYEEPAVLAAQNHLYGERGGGAARAVQQDELFHHQGRPHPQGGVSACLVQEQQKGESLRRQGV
ncbi:hypothetical protein EE612_030837 [Oryza sativa]|nr:hypothetical protein EE612_030837 [Oryza sativa]